MNISQEEKKIILNLARKTISSIFKPEDNTNEDYPDSRLMNSKCGVFVTLKIDDALRGCIGYIITDKLLADTIKDAAIEAALNDPRFEPLSKDELPKIEIEVSILSEPFPMKDYEEIEIGKHGLILQEKGRRALLLPQVPVEYGMDRNTFLSALCRKGGFKSDLWKEKKLRIDLFTAEVFSEKEMEE